MKNRANSTTAYNSNATLDELLNQFYLDNGIPENGGIDKDTFEMGVFGINLKLPNPKFRKEVTHIHDIQHILNHCDTSWKGEGYIAGWEMATGFWKYAPICIFSFWAMGYSLWLYPKSVYEGFTKGLTNVGIIELNITKTEFMKMEFQYLEELTKKKGKQTNAMSKWFGFLLCSFISQIVFLFPLIFILLLNQLSEKFLE